MHDDTYNDIHHDAISIMVKSEFVPDQSNTQESRYVFAYHVTIENHGTQPAQLISRHWVITDGNQKTQEVRGEGVIGEQPTILPGKAYKYSSGAVLQTPVGSMQGTYQMVDNTGNHFDALIPIFTLASPKALH